MRYSFTGPTEATGIERHKAVYRVLARLDVDNDTEFTTGGAFGIDTIAFFEAMGNYPTAKHRVCVPDGEPYNTIVSASAHDAAERGQNVEVIYVPGGYMKRNDALVAHCDVLLAFPPTAQEQLRSGTWATIRRARKAGKEVLMYPLA